MSLLKIKIRILTACTFFTDRYTMISFGRRILISYPFLLPNTCILLSQPFLFLTGIQRYLSGHYCSNHRSVQVYTQYSNLVGYNFKNKKRSMAHMFWINLACSKNLQVFKFSQNFCMKKIRAIPSAHKSMWSGKRYNR